MNGTLMLRVEAVIPILGLLSGLIGAYVALQNRALLAEVRQELAELENRIITRINGTYARNAECLLRHGSVDSRMDDLSNEVRDLSRAGRHTEE